MPDPNPNVSIVILNWNGLADTRECLRSLQSVDYENKRVIVVDNGSAGGDARLLRGEFGDSVEVIESRSNLGFAAGANLGIRHALGLGTDYVLLLNNDTTVDPAFLRELVESARSLPDTAAMCPKAFFHDRPNVIYSTGGRVNMWTGVARQVGRGELDRAQFEHVVRRDYADGVCMLIPKPALDQVGMLDEDYFAYWEETDWCARARGLGLQCYYVPAARIWHKAARSQSPDARFQYLYRRNAIMFVRKHGRPVQLATTLLMLVFVYAPRYFLRHPTKIGRAAAELRALLWHAGNRARRRPLL